MNAQPETLEEQYEVCSYCGETGTHKVDCRIDQQARLDERNEIRAIEIRHSIELDAENRIGIVPKDEVDRFLVCSKCGMVGCDCEPAPMSNCCNAPIKEDSDICSKCGEHCISIEDEQKIYVSVINQHILSLRKQAR